MEFFNKLGKKASEAYKVTADKTGKLAKEAKIRMKINELKGEIDTIYEEIGKEVYENHVREEKKDLTEILEEKCTKIDCLSDEIETNLKECLELKDKRRCENCYTEIDKDVKFCPECGAKQEEIVEDPAKEAQIVTDNNENLSDNDQKNDDENVNVDCQEKSNLEKTVEVESDVDENHKETVEHLEVEDTSDNVE